jgi:TPR repeat protein
MLLLRVAEGLLAAGDLSAARTVLRRAAQAGNARAALLLGETYDIGLLRRFVCSPDADRAAARNWYRVAREFGSTDARQRLDRLAHCEPEGDLPSRP